MTHGFRIRPVFFFTESSNEGAGNIKTKVKKLAPAFKVGHSHHFWNCVFFKSLIHTFMLSGIWVYLLVFLPFQFLVDDFKATDPDPKYY